MTRRRFLGVILIGAIQEPYLQTILSYLQKISPNLQTIKTSRGNCLQIWPLSGPEGSSIPGFLQDYLQ